MDHIPGIRLNVQQSDTKSNYAYFPVIFNEKEFGYTRDDVYEELKKKNIYARKYFIRLRMHLTVIKDDSR